MRTVYYILSILLALPVFASCSTTSENITEIVTNNIEKKDSIKEKRDSSETEITPQEDLSNTISKLEEYFQLYRGRNYAEGAAIFGDFLFQASLSSELYVYNFAQKEYIATIKLSNIGHADTMCFGTEKVDENDEFPILYISGSQVYEEGKRGNIYAYRLIRQKDEQGVENWSGTLIQHIKTPDVAVVGSFPDVVIDEKENCMWMVGWFQNMGYNSDDGSGCTYIFSKYQMPSITEGTKDKKGVYQFVMSEENRMSYFLTHDVHAITQGLCFYNGMIICPYGKPDVPYKGIDFVDVNKEQVVANIDLAGSLINEAEAAVVANETLYLVGQKSCVYKCVNLNLSTLGEMY